MVVLNSTEDEIKFKNKLREMAIKKMHDDYDHVNHREFDILSLAAKLSMSDVQVEALIAKKDWSIETGIRVCKALELCVILDVEEYRH